MIYGHPLGIVLQDTHLFTGSIADNIRYGKLDASLEEVIKPAKLANADSFITRLPQGYDTWISGDGKNLHKDKDSYWRLLVQRLPIHRY